MKNPMMPIILGEPHDWGFYRSLSNAENSIEAIDVKNDVYIGYDAEGRKLNIEFKFNKDQDIWSASITISLEEEKPNHATELSEHMREYLKILQSSGSKINFDISNADLQTLVAEAEKLTTS